MFKPSTAKSSKVLGLIWLTLFSFASSGCATRVLMSSDRYETPETESQQFRYSDDFSRSWQPQSTTLEQAYLELKHGRHEVPHVL